MKQARASNEEVEALIKWLAAQESKGVHVPPWRRTVFGYQTLIKNACDPTLDYLEWKPEILTALNVAGIHKAP